MEDRRPQYLGEADHITVTAQTLSVLAAQPKYAELLALYMAYVEVSAWQHNRSVRATSDFMAKRLGWRRDKVSALKKPLIALGLIEDVIRKGEAGKIEGHYILIRHVYHPPLNSAGGLEDTLAVGDTSTKELNISTIRDNISTLDEIGRPTTTSLKSKEEENINPSKKSSAKKGSPLDTLAPKLREALEALIEERAARKKPMSLRALELCIRQLNKLYPNDVPSQIASVEQSIINGWSGVFTVRQQPPEFEENPITRLMREKYGM